MEVLPIFPKEPEPIKEVSGEIKEGEEEEEEQE